MADLTWGDVVLIGVVATLGFTFLSFWFSGVMSRRGWNWQAKGKARKAAAKRARGSTDTIRAEPASAAQAPGAGPARGHGPSTGHGPATGQDPPR